MAAMLRISRLLSPMIRRWSSTIPAPSYTELGTQYELQIQHFLLHTLNIQTKHIGGRADGGVDLRGDWPLPTTTTVNVIVQCKNISSKCPPNTVRELEGVLARQPGHVGILACTQPASELARHRLHASPLPIMFLMVPFVNGGGGDGVEGEVGEAVLSEAFREAVPQLCVSAAISMDYQSGKRTDRLLFTFNGRPFRE